jgi:hypothetical protein
MTSKEKPRSSAGENPREATNQPLAWPAVAVPLSGLSLHLHRIYMQMWNVPPSVYTKVEREESSSGMRLYNPVPNPVSFKRKHFHLLKSQDYLVAEKTHGQRCTLLMTRTREGAPVNVLVDRKCNFYSVNLVGHRSLYEGLGTCFDGELVRGHRGEWFLVVFDTVMVGGVSYMLEPSYAKRLDLARDHLLTFRKAKDLTKEAALEGARDKKISILSYKITGLSLPPILLRVKPTFSMESPGQAIRSALHLDQGGQHEWPTDGLIFTPAFMEIQKETHDKMIKVKDLEANTVDFRMVVEKRPKEKERLLEFRYRRHGKEEDICAGEGFPFIGYNLKVEVENTKALQKILARFRSDRSKAVQDTIVECQCILDLEGTTSKGKDSEPKDSGEEGVGAKPKDARDYEPQETLTIAVWNERKDKGHPNSMTTLYGTLETLHTGIGSKELLSYFE